MSPCSAAHTESGHSRKEDTDQAGWGLSGEPLLNACSPMEGLLPSPVPAARVRLTRSTGSRHRQALGSKALSGVPHTRSERRDGGIVDSGRVWVFSHYTRQK